MILSSKSGTNANIFPDILLLYAKVGDRILDATYGLGVFWKNVDTKSYRLTKNDLITVADVSSDFRNLPFVASFFDMVVLDPPYAYSPKGTMKDSISKCYQNNGVNIVNMKAVLKLYRDGIAEAKRVLSDGGVLVVKCQDIVESGKQWWMHTYLMQSDGFICEDLFVLMQNVVPALDPKWKKQRHARKNHSFFVVLRKSDTRDKNAVIAVEPADIHHGLF